MGLTAKTDCKITHYEATLSLAQNAAESQVAEGERYLNGPAREWLYRTGQDKLSRGKPVIELFQQQDFFSDMAPNLNLTVWKEGSM